MKFNLKVHEMCRLSALKRRFIEASVLHQSNVNVIDLIDHACFRFRFGLIESRSKKEKLTQPL